MTRTRHPKHNESMTTRIRDQQGTRTRLVRDARDLQEWTWDRTADTRTALLLGLKEYLETLEIDNAGRAFRFRHVFDSHAEFEHKVEFPSAVVYALGTGSYDNDRLSPETFYLKDGSRRALRRIAELELDVTIDFWTTDRIERMSLMAMLEDALDPHEYMTGLRLELPHYHNVRATFEKLSSSYEDSPPEVQKRLWKGSVSLRGHIAQIQRVGVLAELRPSLRLTVDDTMESTE